MKEFFFSQTFQLYFSGESFTHNYLSAFSLLIFLFLFSFIFCFVLFKQTFFYKEYFCLGKLCREEERVEEPGAIKRYSREQSQGGGSQKKRREREKKGAREREKEGG